MWISKKKFNQMMAEAVEKEREREVMYRFMDEMHMKTAKMEDIILHLEDEITELRHIVHSRVPVGKKQLNG